MGARRGEATGSGYWTVEKYRAAESYVDPGI